MAGGPIHPFSAMPDASGEVFPHILKTSGGVFIEGLGVTTATLLTADRHWDLFFQIPETLPTGSPKLRLLTICAAADAGDILASVLWVTGDPSGFDPDASLNDEGTASTISTHTTADLFVETKIALDVATAPAAGEIVRVQLVFEDTGTDVSAVTVHIPSIIWE